MNRAVTTSDCHVPVSADTARRTASCCGRCGRALGETEPTWWVRWVGARTPTCDGCTPDHWKRHSRRAPCLRCGRTVGTRSRARLTFCSDRCEWTWRNRQRRSHRAAQSLPCASCGEPLTGRRASARTCSGRCRQRAHRAGKRDADRAHAHVPSATGPRSIAESRPDHASGGDAGTRGNTECFDGFVQGVSPSCPRAEGPSCTA